MLHQPQLIPNPLVTFTLQDGRSFKAEIFVDKMPLTSANFLDLVHQGFYDGLHVHRSIADFMLQYGCPYARSVDPVGVREKSGKYLDQRAGCGGPEDGEFTVPGNNVVQKRTNGGCIKDEWRISGCARISNEAFTLSMANTGDPDTGGSQFFINTANNTFLDFWDRTTPSQHPVFGKIVEGQDLITELSEKETIEDVPIVPIQIINVSIDSKEGATSPESKL
jgi:cyclophilin family peptidyl-prolyl cis-trans isomerase